jgi:hypothetical protein
MTSAIRLLTALDEAQLRRLEPRLYHLVLSGPPGPGTAAALSRAADADAAPEPYALVVEPLSGVRGLLRSSTLRLPRAVHVSLVTRSPLSLGLVRALGGLGHLAGGPRVVPYQSLEAGFAAAQRALAVVHAQPPSEAPPQAPPRRSWNGRWGAFREIHAP